MRYFETPGPGGRFSARDLRDWIMETRRLGKWTVNGGSLESTPGGMILTIDQKQGFWARILENGGGGLYGWERVDLSPTGESWVPSRGGEWGNWESDAAVEQGFQDDVSVGEIVYLHPAIAGEYKTVGGFRIPRYYLFTKPDGISVVKVTGVMYGGYYPGSVQYLDPATGNWMSGSTVKIVDMNSQELTTIRYFAKRWSTVTISSVIYPLFVTYSPGEVVTNVTCSGGTLTVTKERV